MVKAVQVWELVGLFEKNGNHNIEALRKEGDFSFLF